MNVKLDKYATMPEKAHDTDAGFDIFAPDFYLVKAGRSCAIKTGVHVELPEHTVGMLKSKSGLNFKHGITSEGVVDEGYTGEICVKLYNHSNEDYLVQKGDKITQLVILPTYPITNKDLTLVDNFKATDRGDEGFGSTGR